MSSLEKTEKKSVSWSKTSTIALGVLVVLWIGFRVILPDAPTLFAGSQPQGLGVKQGQLSPCPSTPNCVSSQSQDTEHYIEPLNYQGDNYRDAMTRLKEIITNQPRSYIVGESDNYLYAQFTSQWLGFVDDVEFYANPDKLGVIEVRSASRLGESDLGINRERIEIMRENFKLKADR